MTSSTDGTGGNPPETPGGTPPGTAPQPARPSRWYVAAPAVALVVGLVLGGLLVGVAGGGGLDDLGGDGTGATEAPESAGVASSDPEDEEPGTAVVVPDTCVEAADSAQRVVDALRRGISAIRELRAQEVIDLLDELEDIDARVRDQVDACREVEVTDSALETTPATPSTPSTPATPEPSTD
ncbi:hypothetical protein [Nocardioides sp. SYSU DS0663]|uniref:hypothetical protein n=1 Tax=Nocardioides sp. SYSU DS0663 TaxID=3416445 RepID=UPI003F4B0EAD